ncbi:MAG: F0F1 ATP synthase subunit A [Clostridiales bacterium]|nr:F0F1 ATP synthase subunit A [Clostridiales bacterium]
MTVPFLCGIVLKILTAPAKEGIEISGAQIYFTINMPLQPFYVTEAQINSVIVTLFILGFCLFLTHGLEEKPNKNRQVIAEYVVETVDGLVETNMGDRYAAFSPFIAAIIATSAFSSLSSLLGLFPPTADINVIAGWSILVFILITHFKLKGGLWNYVKGYFEPIPVFAPLNVIGEIATPVSMTFRHFGNVLSGVVISTLIAAALSGVSNLILGWLPGIFGEIAIFRVGLPAVLSLYFDLFSGCLQAFIFAMLTMLNISNGFPEEEYEKRMKKKIERQRAKEEARALAEKQ